MPTGIEWTDETWNPVVGCERVSPGCAHCYAKALHDQRHTAHLAGKPMAAQYRVPFETVQLKPERLTAPLSWRAPRRIFVNSVSDLFHEDVPDHYIEAVFGVMAYTRHHTFQILTKRPGRMLEWFRRPRMLFNGGAGWQVGYCHGAANDLLVGSSAWERAYKPGGEQMPGDGLIPWPLPNVWLGVSVENQRWADERIPLLLQTPAAVRFLSCEPLLGPLDIMRFLAPAMHVTQGVPPHERKPFSTETVVALNQLGRAAVTHYGGGAFVDWVIAGGESGTGARPMHPAWASSLRDQCVAACVPFFFKQWGEWLPDQQLRGRTREHMQHMMRAVREHEYVGIRESGVPNTDWASRPADAPRTLVLRVGKKCAGRELDGREWNEMPGVGAIVEASA